MSIVPKLINAIELIIPQSETEFHSMIKSTRESLPYAAPGVDVDKYYDLVTAIMAVVDKTRPPYRALLSNVLRGKIDIDLVFEEKL